MTRIAVGVIDGHEVFRRGVIACLREDPDLEVLELASAAGDTAVDVVIASGEVARSRDLTRPAVVCFARESEAAGLSGRPNVVALLPRRSVTPEQLVASVRAAAAGLQINVEAPIDQGISDRGREVLRLLAAGADTREISSELGYSERTIKAAIHEIQAALGTRNRTHAVAEAVRANLI